MDSDSDNMRKLINVISEDGPLAPGVFIDPLASTSVDSSMDDPMDDVPTAGAETKIEVTMKDGDEVEVEVYATQGKELNRLMDLAGMFHKDKQNGMLSNIPSISATPDMTPDMDMEPDMDMTPDMDMEPDMDMTPDMDMEPDMDTDVPMGGPDIPAGSDLDNIELDTVDSSEVDFDLDYEESTGMQENITKKHDFGHPNPMAGQEGYELSAFNFSGHGAKPVRYVPARSGDNPMVNTSDRKGLKEYIDEIDNSKKKVIGENIADDAAENTVSSLAAGVNVDDNTLDKLKNVAKNKQQGASPDDDDSETMDDVLDAAQLSGVKINPNTQRELEKNVSDKQRDDSIKETDFKISVIDEEDLEEKKRRYSFSHAEFGRGIITSPEAKRKRAARRGLSIYKK